VSITIAPALFSVIVGIDDLEWVIKHWTIVKDECDDQEARLDNGLIQKTTSQDFAIFSDLEFLKNDSFFATRRFFFVQRKISTNPCSAESSSGAESMLMFSPNELSQSIILRHYGRWHEMEVALTNKNHFQSGRIWKFFFNF